MTDDNLLACSEQHIRAVFAMLGRQPKRPQFTGGLEAARLAPWHVDLLSDIRPERMYFAYDTKNDLEPLRCAGRMLAEAGFTRESRRVSAYVLIGYSGDSFSEAEQRLRKTWEVGFFPFAMLYHDESGQVEREWRQFQRSWAAPAAVGAQIATRDLDAEEKNHQ